VLSALLHAALAAALSLEPPPSLDVDEDRLALEEARRLSFAAVARPPDRSDGPTDSSDGDLPGRRHDCHKGVGRTGPQRLVIMRASETQDAKLARARLLIDSGRYGALGALSEVLPGIGPALARRIIKDRESNGPFGCLAALDRVKGVGPALLARIDSLATFSAPCAASGPARKE
jgi:hypothetical protein